MRVLAKAIAKEKALSDVAEKAQNRRARLRAWNIKQEAKRERKRQKRILSLPGRIDRLNRARFYFAMSLDASLGTAFPGGRELSLHEGLASNVPAPDELLIRKEECAEKDKLDKYQKRRHRKIPIYRPRDFEQEKADALRLTAPSFPGRRGKNRSRITKYSPERGITQRHIKMAPVQFV